MYLNYLTHITNDLYDLVNHLANELDVELIPYTGKLSTYFREDERDKAIDYVLTIDDLSKIDSNPHNIYILKAYKVNHIEFFKFILIKSLNNRALLEDIYYSQGVQYAS